MCIYIYTAHLIEIRYKMIYKNNKTKQIVVIDVIAGNAKKTA